MPAKRTKANEPQAEEMIFNTLNRQLCIALGVRDMDSLIEAVLEIRPNQPPTLIVRRHVLDPNEFASMSKMVGLTTTTSTISATNIVAH